MTEKEATQWLSLREASELLGVHPSTLRRWADAGTIPCTRTPGGHRRFRRSDVERMLHAEQRLAPSSSAPIGPVGVEVGEEEEFPPPQEWHGPFVEAQKVEALRPLGQRLLGLLLQFLTRHEEDERFLAEGQKVGYEYGRECYLAHISLLDAVKAFLYYRATAAREAIDMPAAARLMEHHDSLWLQRRIDRFMNAVLLGLIAAYEEARGYLVESKVA